jgi:hypothetical protein
MIREIKPNVLERYISGPFDPNDVVPVAPGEPPMTIAGFLNASMAAGAPGCIITPRLSLDDLYDTTSCPWSTEFTNCFWATAHNLFNLPVSPPIRTVSLDNWSEFSDSHSAAEIGDVLKKMAAMGWEHIACNYVGGNANSYGIADIGMFGVDVHNGFEPKLSRYGTIITNASIDRVLLYIDFPKQMDGFLQLDPDARADKLLQIGAWQATYDFTFVWPVLQGRWDSTRIFTTPGGPYGGASLYKVMLDAMKHYNADRSQRFFHRQDEQGLENIAILVSSHSPDEGIRTGDAGNTYTGTLRSKPFHPDQTGKNLAVLSASLIHIDL